LDDSEALARADRAAKIINDPLFNESFEIVKKAVFASIETSPVRDTEGREHLFKMLKALNDAKGYLEQAIQDGKVLIHLKEEKRRFSLFR
jgi:hypothetical protein